MSEELRDLSRVRTYSGSSDILGQKPVPRYPSLASDPASINNSYDNQSDYAVGLCTRSRELMKVHLTFDYTVFKIFRPKYTTFEHFSVSYYTYHLFYVFYPTQIYLFLTLFVSNHPLYPFQSISHELTNLGPSSPCPSPIPSVAGSPTYKQGSNKGRHYYTRYTLYTLYTRYTLYTLYTL